MLHEIKEMYMHWLQSATTARPSHPKAHTTKSSRDSVRIKHRFSAFTSMKNSEVSQNGRFLWSFLNSYYRSMFLWLWPFNFKSRVPHKDGMCMLPARRLQRLQCLSGKSLLRLLGRYAWCLKSSLHNYKSPWRLYRHPPSFSIHLLPTVCCENSPACTEAKHYIIFASYSSTSPEELALKNRALGWYISTGTGQKQRQRMSMTHNFRQKSEHSNWWLRSRPHDDEHVIGIIPFSRDEITSLPCSACEQEFPLLCVIFMSLSFIIYCIHLHSISAFHRLKKHRVHARTWGSSESPTGSSSLYMFSPFLTIFHRPSGASTSWSQDWQLWTRRCNATNLEDLPIWAGYLPSHFIAVTVPIYWISYWCA